MTYTDKKLAKAVKALQDKINATARTGVYHYNVMQTLMQNVVAVLYATAIKAGYSEEDAVTLAQHELGNINARLVAEAQSFRKN
jgi:hypothetical protein